MPLSYLYNLATDKYKGPLFIPLKSLLYLLSLLYGLTVRTLVLIYRIRPYRLNCRVISVGNITLGGTGKTSLVLLIARCLREKGHRVAILSRGYKRKITDYETMGDEPYLLKANLKDVPVIVDTDRVRAGKRAVRDYALDTVILDDGFQQWRIKKDLEIVTIDSASLFGNRRLIPRGILREPLSSLKRADVLVLTKTNLAEVSQETKNFLKEVNPRALIIESIHNPSGFYQVGKDEVVDAQAFKGKTATLFSGIGSPASFEDLIKGLGIKVGLSFRFPDHYPYAQKDLENIIRVSQKNNIDTIITTEKDAARLYELRVTNYELRVLFLRIELKITTDEERFYRRLLGLYSG